MSVKEWAEDAVRIKDAIDAAEERGRNEIRQAGSGAVSGSEKYAEWRAERDRLIAEILAAERRGEERGRRCGDAERDELRAALRTYRRHHPCDYCETKHVPDLVEKALADLLAAVTSSPGAGATADAVNHARALLAPRDSAPKHPFEPCHNGFDLCAYRDKPGEFPCNKPFRDHDQAPRDSGKET